jgi:transcriptional regulator with XRE-family HTH domain
MTSRFGEQLQRLRQQAGMTQEQLAERAGLGVRTVRRLETDERTNARFATVDQLADALKLDPAARLALFAAANQVTREPDQVHDVVANATSSLREPAVLGTKTRNPGPLVEAAGDLAHAVGARWLREEELRWIHDPIPLLVRWLPAPPELTDYWENIRRVRPGDVAEPLDLAGHFGEVADVYRRIPSGRLVVLGRAGAGKTVLIRRLVLDLLASRAASDPVPVVFGLGSWRPDTSSFRDWTIEQLVLNHPGLAALGPGGVTLAAGLVESGWVLPVLDGFDEIADGLRCTALDALNATTLPLVLTSRTGEYVDAVTDGGGLTAAACVRLTDLTAEDLADYLPRTALAWRPVAAELRDHPDLVAALATPGMAALASTVYRDHDPAELLDTDRFPTRTAIEDHLLDNLVPTAYGRPTVRWSPKQAGRWLGYLARHMDRIGTRDLAWWQLGGTLSTWLRALVVGVVAGLVLGVAGVFVDWPGAPVYGLLAGLGLGLVHVLGGTGFVPSRVRAPVTRAAFPTDLLRATHRTMIVQTVALTLVVGVAAGLTFGLRHGVVLGLAGGLGFVLIVWGQWVVLARMWLPLTGRLPWALIEFLEDASHRGVLCRTGTVYRFRHASLQNRLARDTDRVPDVPVSVSELDTVYRRNLAGTRCLVQAYPEPARGLPVSIYLTDDTGSGEVEAAVVDLLDVLDIDITASRPPIIGSWLGFRFGRFRKALGSEEAKEILARAERAIEARAVGLPQAEIDGKLAEAAARLITALENQRDAFVQVGSLCVLKVDGMTIVRNLSPREMSFLVKNQTALTAPAEILRILERANDAAPAIATAPPPEAE